MAGNNNKKFLFRQPGLDPDVDQPQFLPHDVKEWFDQFGKLVRGASGYSIEDGMIGSGFGNGFPGGMSGESPGGEYNVPDIKYDTSPIPGLTAKQPFINAVVEQRVVQDPQGTATVSVTFDIGPEQDNMRYELRLSKA